MIALDTNVLLRYILNDDEEQSKVVADILKQLTEKNPAFVSLIVLVELTWVLQGRQGFSKKVTCTTIKNLLNTKELKIEHEDTLLSEFSKIDFTKTDIADWLIGVSGKVAGCDHTITFDKTAAKHISAMELLA